MSVKSLNVIDYADSYFNCFIQGGELKVGYDISTVRDVPLEDVLYAAYSSAAQKYVFCNPDKTAVFKGGNGFQLINGYSGSAKFMLEDFIDGNPMAVLFNGSQLVKFDTGVTTYVTLYNGKFTCGAVHCGRAFAANGLHIYWSGTDGVKDLFELNCGELHLDFKRGKVLNMLVFDGKLIAVREFGLSVLSMYGSPENFSVDLTDTDCDLIYKDTACVIENKLYFFSESGLKTFDGSKIQSVSISYAVSSPRSAASCAGIYYLACQSAISGEKIILCLDTRGKSVCIVNERAEFLFENGGIHFVGEGKHKRLKARNYFKDGSPFYLSSKDIDFGTRGFKTVTKLETSDAVTLTISNGRHTRVYELEKGGVVFPHMKGKSFKVTAEGIGDVKFLKMTAEVADGV